jgi:DNA-binding IclR family transcriptional regulator
MSKIVERTLDLLELFAQEKRPLSLSDIARLLKIPVSSCHDVLQAMQSRGYIYELAPRAGYYPTLRLQGLGKEIGDHDPVVLRAELLLRSLRDTLDESVLLAKVTGLQASYLLAFEPTHPLRFLVKVGDNVRSLYAIKLRPLTDRTVMTKTALRDEIDKSRDRGWYLNQGESLDGVTTLSAVFRWNTAAYIVTVAGPSSRLDAKLEQAVGLLTNVCTMLEMRPNGTGAATRTQALARAAD